MICNVKFNSKWLHLWNMSPEDSFGIIQDLCDCVCSLVCNVDSIGQSIAYSMNDLHWSLPDMIKKTFLCQRWFTCNGCALDFGSTVKLGYLARTLKSRNRAKSINTFAKVKLYHNLFDHCATTMGLLRNRRRLAQCRCHEATLCHDLSWASYLWDMSDYFMEGWLRLILPHFEKEGSLDMSWWTLVQASVCEAFELLQCVRRVQKLHGYMMTKRWMQVLN